MDFANVQNVNHDFVSSKDIHLFPGILLILGHEGSDVNFIRAGISWKKK